MEEEKDYIESFPCEKCGKIFPYKYALKRHRRYCTDAAPESCSNCNKVLKNRASLMSHQKLCLRLERKLPCMICNKTFKHTNNLRRHLRYYHGIQNNKFLILAAENNDLDELSDENTFETGNFSQSEISEDIYTLQFGAEYDDSDIKVCKLTSSNQKTNDTIENCSEKDIEEEDPEEMQNFVFEYEDSEDENKSDMVSLSITRLIS